jgi:hypothetical protein
MPKWDIFRFTHNPDKAELTIEYLWMSLSHRGAGFMTYGPEAEA